MTVSKSTNTAIEYSKMEIKMILQIILNCCIRAKQLTRKPEEKTKRWQWMEQYKIFRREYNLGIIFSNSCYCYYSNRKNALEEFVSENKIKLKGEDK